MEKVAVGIFETIIQFEKHQADCYIVGNHIKKDKRRVADLMDSLVFLTLRS